MDFARILTIVSRRWPLLWRAGIRPIDCGQSIILESWCKQYIVSCAEVEKKMLESGYADDMDKYEARLHRLVEKALARQRPKHTDLPHAQSCFKTVHSYEFTHLYDKVLGHIPSYHYFAGISDKALAMECAIRYGCVCQIIKQLPMPIANEIIEHLP